MDIRPLLYVIGILLTTLSLSMLLPIFADIAVGNPDWKVFFTCMIFTAFIGGALILTNEGNEFDLDVRQAFLLTVLSWITLALAAAAPFALSGLQMSVTDSIFEAVSGITTTGSTVMTGLNDAPPGILLWRAILQWLGGIGIIVMALSVLPFLKVGGMQLFQTESSENEKAMPRAAQLSASIGLIYLGLTLACMFAYRSAGMNSFDALAHAMTTIATGGFSTFDSSFGHYDDAWAEIVAIIFMLMGGMPFILYMKALRGNWKALFQDSQVRAFLAIVVLSITVMIAYLVLQNNETFGEALRRASFNVVSVITGTGYTNGDYNLWGGFAVILMFFLMVVGGCAGSTTCGIKVFRFQVLYAVTISQLKQLLHPHGIFTPHYNKQALPAGVAASVMGFFFVYALSFSLLAIGLSFIGLDFLTAMSGAVTSISNVGPGLGEIIGPGGTFQPLPDSAKWMMCGGMILGRLELFTVLVLFLPHFWAK
ncbi:MAG: TrkH family potassium uptake protein [Alphaproteobacteria bacterium]|nr:TrkH family potassium uptake protein [Alphaproteobacteria bacterium]